jgi:predicted nucleic acid-binding protein
MEWLKPLSGQVVGLDTAPLIYFIERHPLYHPLVEPFFASVERGEIEVVTSTLTITEVLVHPYRVGNGALAREYSDILLRARNITVLAVSPEIATEAARIRAMHGIRTPDAIQLATAHEGHAHAFLTNDEDLEKAGQLPMLVLKRMVSGKL